MKKLPLSRRDYYKNREKYHRMFTISKGHFNPDIYISLTINLAVDS